MESDVTPKEVKPDETSNGVRPLISLSASPNTTPNAVSKQSSQTPDPYDDAATMEKAMDDIVAEARADDTFEDDPHKDYRSHPKISASTVATSAAALKRGSSKTLDWHGNGNGNDNESDTIWESPKPEKTPLSPTDVHPSTTPDGATTTDETPKTTKAPLSSRKTVPTLSVNTDTGSEKATSTNTPVVGTPAVVLPPVFSNKGADGETRRSTLHQDFCLRHVEEKKAGSFLSLGGDDDEDEVVKRQLLPSDGIGKQFIHMLSIVLVQVRKRVNRCFRILKLACSLFYASLFKLHSVYGNMSKLNAIVLFFLGIYSVTAVPYHISFKDHEGLFHPNVILGVDLTALAMLLAQFRITYVDKRGNEEIISSRKILKQRLHSTRFLLGMLSAIQLNQIHWGFHALKIFRMMWIFNLGDAFAMTNDTPFHQLAKIISIVFVNSHIIACSWHLLIQKNDTLEAHLELIHYEDIEHHSMMGNRFYWWAFRDSTFLLLGKDRKGVNDEELAFLAIMGIFGAFNVATLYGNCTWLIQLLLQKKMKRFQEMTWVQTAVNGLPIPKDLRNRILDYYKYITFFHDKALYDNLFKGLSPTLLLELKLYLYADLLCESPFFEGVPLSAIKSMVLKLEIAVYSEGDYIIQKDDPALEMFFIVRGVCEVILELGCPAVCQFKAGRYFGEMALYRGTSQRALRTAWVRAVTYCQLARMTRAAFQSMLQEYPESEEIMYKKIGDQVSKMQAKNAGEETPDEDSSDADRDSSSEETSTSEEETEGSPSKVSEAKESQRSASKKSTDTKKEEPKTEKDEDAHAEASTAEKKDDESAAPAAGEETDEKTTKPDKADKESAVGTPAVPGSVEEPPAVPGSVEEPPVAGEPPAETAEAPEEKRRRFKSQSSMPHIEPIPESEAVVPTNSMPKQRVRSRSMYGIGGPMGFDSTHQAAMFSAVSKITAMRNSAKAFIHTKEEEAEMLQKSRNKRMIQSLMKGDSKNQVMAKGGELKDLKPAAPPPPPPPITPAEAAKKEKDKKAAEKKEDKDKKAGEKKEEDKEKKAGEKKEEDKEKKAGEKKEEDKEKKAGEKKEEKDKKSGDKKEEEEEKKDKKAGEKKEKAAPPADGKTATPAAKPGEPDGDDDKKKVVKRKGDKTDGPGDFLPLSAAAAKEAKRASSVLQSELTVIRRLLELLVQKEYPTLDLANFATGRKERTESLKMLTHEFYPSPYDVVSKKDGVLKRSDSFGNHFRDQKLRVQNNNEKTWVVYKLSNDTGNKSSSSDKPEAPVDKSLSFSGAARADKMFYRGLESGNKNAQIAMDSEFHKKIDRIVKERAKQRKLSEENGDTDLPKPKIKEFL